MNLTGEQTDAITELVNIGVGQASASLNELLDFAVTLSVPSVQLITDANAGQYLGSDPGALLAGVQMNFSGGCLGTAELVFPPESARHLVAVLVGEKLEVDQRDSVWVGTLTEVGNILLNGVMGTISNALEAPLEYDVPAYFEAAFRDLVEMGSSDDDSTLVARTRFSVDELSVEGDVILVFEAQSFRAILDMLEEQADGLD